MYEIKCQDSLHDLFLQITILNTRSTEKYIYIKHLRLSNIELFILIFRNVEPYDKVELKLKLKPIKKGRREVLASFDSKELGDVTGSAFIQISDA